MANTLARMERDDLIVRHSDPSDGRAQRVWLTKRARGLRAPAIAAAQAENAVALSALSEDERKLFIGLMQKVIAHGS